MNWKRLVWSLLQNDHQIGTLIQTGILIYGRHYYIFFEKCTFPELILHWWNALGWIDRARKLRPSMYVSNVDLLFRLQQSMVAYQNLSKSQDEARKNETVKEIIFTSRQKVEVVEKKWSLLNDDDVQLGPDFIEREFYYYSNTCLCLKKAIFYVTSLKPLILRT